MGRKSCTGYPKIQWVCVFDPCSLCSGCLNRNMDPEAVTKIWSQNVLFPFFVLLSQMLATFFVVFRADQQFSCNCNDASLWKCLTVLYMLDTGYRNNTILAYYTYAGVLQLFSSFFTRGMNFNLQHLRRTPIAMARERSTVL